MQTISIMRTAQADFTADVLIDWVIQDLTWYTANFIMIDCNWVEKVNSPATIVDATNWKVSYSPISADVNTVWEYEAYFMLVVAWVNQFAAPTEKYSIKILSD